MMAAPSISTIDLIFNGVDRVSGVARNVSDSLGGLSDSAKNISAPFADMAGKLGVMQAGMTALAGVIGSLAFNESAQFQSALGELQKQLAKNEGSASDYAATLENLALKYGVNNNELVKSAADFKAAGYDIDTSIKMVKSSMDLAIAGSVETSQAVDFMNRSLAGFQVPASDVAKEAGHIGDVLNKTADLTKSSFTELANGFADLSPIAKQTGMSVEDTAAIISKVVDVFGSGSEAANALKSSFLSLVDPSKESAKAMADMGANYKNADGSLKSVKQILSELSPAFNKLDESQRLAAASIIFGKDHAGKMVQVMTQYNDTMDLSAKLTKEAGGSIEKEVTIKLQQAEITVKRTNEAFRQLLQAIGDQTLVNTGGVIGSIGDLAIAFRDVIHSGALEPLFAKLREQLGGIESLFKTVAKNLPEAFKDVKFDGLLNAFDELGAAAKSALEALFGPIDIRTVDGLRDALQKVVNMIENITRLTAGELGGLKPFLQGIGALAESFNDADSGTKTFLGNLIGLGLGVQSAAGYFDGINTALLSFIAFGPKLAQLPATIREIAAGFNLFATSGNAAKLGLAGVAAGVGLLTFEITRMTGLDKTLNDILMPDWLAGYKGASLGSAAADVAEKLGLMGPAANSAAQGIAVLPPYFKEQTAAAKETRLEINAHLDAQEKAAKSAYDTSREIDLLTASFKAQGYEYDAATGKLTKLSQTLAGTGKDVYALADNIKVSYNVMGEAGTKTGTLQTSLSGISRSYEQIGGGTVKATGAFKAVSDSASEQAQKVDEAVKKAQEYQIKMEEIASNERIKTIEAVISLNVEQVKADAERVKSAFESINTGIASTGDLLGGLFGNLKDADFHARSLIEEQISQENKRRQQQFDLQKELTQAEIERIHAQRDAYARGDALLKIEANGLKPHLEAIWWEVMKAIRVKANAEFQDYLLALGVTP